MLSIIQIHFMQENGHDFSQLQPKHTKNYLFWDGIKGKNTSVGAIWFVYRISNTVHSLKETH